MSHALPLPDTIELSAMNLHAVVVAFDIIVFLFAISVHESSHAWMANRLGDPTARMLGRISLNPIRHIDIIGTVLLPAIAAAHAAPSVAGKGVSHRSPLQ